MFINQRGFVVPVIGIFLLLAIIVSGIYYYYQKTSEVIKPIEFSSPAPQLSPIPQNIANESGVYINKTHKYTVQYPADRSPQNETDNIETQNSVIFGCGSQEEGYCLPPIYISVNPNQSDPTTGGPIYNSLPLDVVVKIFELEVGEELDQSTAKTIGGDWEFSTAYKRLPDETISGEKFLVIENPEGYGGSDRRLLITRNNKLYMIGGIYSNQA